MPGGIVENDRRYSVEEELGQLTRVSAIDSYRYFSVDALPNEQPDFGLNFVAQTGHYLTGVQAGVQFLNFIDDEDY